MPEETSRYVHEIEVRPLGRDALEQLVESIKKVEQAVVSMGEQFDKAAQRIVEPINGLTVAVEKLDTSVGMLNTRLAQADGLNLLGQQAKQAQMDVADLDRTLEQYRMGATKGYKLPGRLGGMFQSREQMVERYMLGQFGGGGMAETVSAPPPTAAPGTTPLTYRSVEELQKRLGLTNEQTSAIQQQITAEERAILTLQRRTDAENRLARAQVRRLSSAGGLISAQLRAQPGWQQQVGAGQQIAGQLRQQPGWQQQVAAGRRVAEDLRGGLLGVDEAQEKVSKSTSAVADAQDRAATSTQRVTQETRRASGMMRYFGRYLLRYLVLWQGIQAVRGISKAWFAAHLEMADAVADFGWRVNATTEDVARYRDTLRDVSMMVGMPVGEIASPLAGQATEGDLLRAAEAAKVFGGSVEDWARKLSAGTASLDAYAHGLRISTLATEDYAKLVDNAGAIAQEFNMSTEETIGLLSALPSVLQSDAEGAAELTEALAGLYEQNQLLMTLGMAPAVRVGPGGAPQRRPMREVMAEIGRQPVAQQRQLAVAIGLTGEKQQQFFLDAIAGWGEVAGAIRETASATGDFDEAMAGADESMKARVASMKASWSGLLATIGDTEAAKGGVTGLANYFKGLTVAIDEPRRALEFLIQLMETATPGELLAMIAMGPTLGPKLMAGLGITGEARARARAEGGGPGPAGGGYAGVTPGTEVPGAAYFPPMPTLRMGEGMGIGQLAAEMERVIDEVFTRPYTTASGEVIQVTKEQIDALRKNTVILDETGEAIGLLNVFAPALAVAQENLKAEMEQQRFNLERLQDITPQQFDTAMRTILPTWEARLAAIPGFEEEKELQTFFVGEQDVLRQQLATQTGMAYTLQDILDTEKDQLEGMWNIPTGVTMRVPLQSLDLMRWMKGTAAGGMPTDMMPAGGPLEAAATAQDNAALAMQTSAGAQTASAASMSDLAQRVGAKIYGGVPVEPGVAKEAALEGDVPGGLQQQINRQPKAIPGAGAAVTPSPWASRVLQAQFAINLVSQLFLDKKIVTEVVQTELSRQLVNTGRAQAGGGASLRP